MKQTAKFVMLTSLLGCFGGCCKTTIVPAPGANAVPNEGPLAAEVRRGEQSTRLVAPSGKAWITPLAQGQNAFLGRLELAPGAKVPQHQDPTEEYIHVVQGGGTLTINGQPHVITAGTTVFMPAGATVSFQNGPQQLIAIQVFAGPGPAAKYGQWKP